MKILAIETSCDETAVSIVEGKGGLKNPHFKEISSKVLSQVELHKEYGGVFPSLAKREHGRNLVPTLLSVLKQGYGNSKSETLNSNPPAGGLNPKIQKELEKILEREPELLEQFLKLIPKIKKPKVDKIAVTYGPGLEPALWVGINFAKALSLVWSASRRMPIIPVNHMEGHMASILPLQNRGNSKSEIRNSKQTRNSKFEIQNNLKTGDSRLEFPAIALLISGGHTELVLIKKWGDYKVIGETLDDAVGEAYDKVARMLKLPYPGGPEISRLADQARNQARKKTTNYGLSIPTHKSGRDPDCNVGATTYPKFPRPMINSEDLNFSFSGLKTSVLYFLKNKKITSELKKEVAQEFEESVAEVLISKTKTALEQTKARSLIIAGGVSANKFLRKSFQKEFGEKIDIFIPPQELSTDNATMIAMAGYLRASGKKKTPKNFKAQGNLSF